MSRIIIGQMFKNDYISRVAGEKLRTLISEAYQKKEAVTLDFSGVIIASTSFFDEGIAKLALEGWDGQRLKTWVLFEGMNPRDRKVMKKVCEFRRLKVEGPL